MPSRLFGFVAMVVVVAAVCSAGHVLGVDLGSPSAAPDARQATPPEPQPQERAVGADPDRKLSAGDKVTIEIVEDRDGGLPRVVTATGEVDVPPLGRVRVAGQTAAEAAANIKRLLEKDIYYTATVRLSIDQVNSVRVSGSVQVPGCQPLMAGKSLTLCGAILKALPTESADLRRVRITRFNKNGSTEQFQVDVDKISGTGDAASDVVLQDGDRIDVPKRYSRYPNF